jgi:bacillopeptidase F
VTADGETVVSGTATDLAGNQTPASVTVHVDTTAPAVALTSPTADLTTTDANVVVTGTVSDAGSGLALVQCNGETATVDQGVASCTVPLRPGRNSVVLLARDAAGHVTSQGLRVTRTGTPTTLTLSPATRTLLVDEGAALSLLDDFGLAVPAATWTSS